MMRNKQCLRERRSNVPARCLHCAESDDVVHNISPHDQESAISNLDRCFLPCSPAPVCEIYKRNVEQQCSRVLDCYRFHSRK